MARPKLSVTLALIFVSTFWTLVLIYPLGYILRRVWVLVLAISSYVCFLLSLYLLHKGVMGRASIFLLSLGIIALTMSALLFLQGGW